jgi:prepilin-type processing-associated H-X9-DG protein
MLDGVFTASSGHNGGVNALLMDGSVRFVRDTINGQVWKGIGTRAGGEILPAY